MTSKGEKAMNNPPIPIGYKLMKQLAVTPSMTEWAIKILHDPQKFPMLASVTRVFNGLSVLARVEWHPPDFQNRAVHRGVTLYAHDHESPQTDLALGIDISGYQPVVDWEKVIASGIAFAFIKATEGTTLIDRSFARHWRDAKVANVLRGAYHFFRPKVDAAAQARLFLAQLDDPGELPPVLDVEVINGVPLAQIATGVNTWVDTVAPMLGRPLIYTSPSFWNALPASAELASKADLWVANWEARAPAAVKGWLEWTFWQFTNKATISGIPGAAEMDEDRFNGSLAELQAYSAEVQAARSDNVGPTGAPKLRSPAV